ncbi:MAG: DUF1501 domain-containing protein [Devosia sp.]
MINRRHFLAASGASVFFAGFPMRGYAQRAEVGKVGVILLEGGMDGLAAVPPVGDQSLKKQRKGLIASTPIALNPFFALHPSLAQFARMLAANEAAIVHATSIPYQKRSHFEGQNLMQSGGREAFASQSGWLGRAMELAGIPGKALALDMPLIVRGGEDLDNLFPVNLKNVVPPKAELIALLEAEHDGDMQAALEKLRIRAMGEALMPLRRNPGSLALEAGKEMAKPDGPNVAVVRITDFDTHAHQGTNDGMLPQRLALIDETFKGFKTGLGPAWKNSIILTLTEFGRTVKENGSEGTEHGYGTAALLAGGLIKRANVVANWPGLSDKELFEGRDLMATLDYRAVCAAAMEAAFGLDHDLVADQVFGEKNLAHVHGLIFGA